MNNHPMYFGKLDVTKILKEHLFPGKGGQKYLDIICIPTPDSKYGDCHVVCQSLPKELRDNGQKGPILGNMKEAAQKPRQAPAQRSERPANQDDGADSDVPF